MRERARPPESITPHDFFTRWIPEAVAEDEQRRERLRDTEAVLEFDVTGDGGGVFTLEVAAGEVRGAAGPAQKADLRIRVDLPTWRQLNSGCISAPEALLRRRMHMRGNLLLAIKLHLILG
jgi:putative sterol carrier protein